MEVILFPHETGSVAVMTPTGALSVEETAKKDVPTGVPYIVMDSEQLPAAPQSEWVIDFSHPTGYGEYNGPSL